MNNTIKTEGVIELMPEGDGYLRSVENNYLPTPNDPIVSPKQIKYYHLKTGDKVKGFITQPKKKEISPELVKISGVNGYLLQCTRQRLPFENLKPRFPDKKFNLSSNNYRSSTTQLIDLITPIGKGQRGLIAAPAKTGKTTIIKELVHGIAHNHPEVYLMVLLITTFWV